MSERDEDPDAMIFRAAIPGRISGSSPRPAGVPWLAPGRGALEVSVLLSALAILVPVCSLGAVVSAVVSRRSGSPRWLAALIAAIWCGMLGVVVRYVIGIELVP
jgi:hypothetical protein